MSSSATDPPSSASRRPDETAGTRRSTARRGPWRDLGVAASLLIGALALATGAYVLLRPSAAQSALTTGAATSLTGGAAPAFEAPHLAGSFPARPIPALGGAGVVELAPGRPAVVAFFASWCPDCRRDLPVLAALARRDGGRVSFVGVDTNDQVGPARALVRADHIPFPIAQASATEASAGYDVAVLPTTFLVDADHRVVGELFGAQSRATLSAWIARLER